MEPGIHYFGVGPEPGKVTNLVKVDVATNGAIDCYSLDGKNNWQYNTNVMKYVLDGEADGLTPAEAERIFATFSRRKKWVP